MFVRSIMLALVAVFATAGLLPAQERPLAHDVYFTLKEDSPANREKLVAACEQYLANQPGVVWFSAGPVAEELARDVNDRDFDVALHLVFRSKAAHDEYQTSPSHTEFVEKTQALWQKVRVFDSYVAASSGRRGQQSSPAAAQ